MRTLTMTLALSISTFASGLIPLAPHFPAVQARAVTGRSDPVGQITYQILCRGGEAGALYFKTADSRTLQSGEKITTYDLIFTASPTAAGTNAKGLSPGQCSWIDRTLRTGEPATIRFDTPLDAQKAQKASGGPVDTSPTAAERFPDAYSIPEYMKDRNHYYSFTVYNYRNEYLLATSSRFFKPKIEIIDVIRDTDGGVFGGGKRIDLDALATKGQALADEDLLTVELRENQTSDARRRGFDIGLAAAEGQTLPGPGKQKIHDLLKLAEQPGFDDAVSFSLDRNRNLELAATGAQIALADQDVAQARDALPNTFYRLGFDIATAIFGDPILGAKGNTATGPGSMRIRDSLSPAAQRGFNAAVTLHLSRDYRR
ncbi:MAG: hypothetical protein ABIP75_16595 [Pyrinomonadaceae bacterium]